MSDNQKASADAEPLSDERLWEIRRIIERPVELVDEFILREYIQLSGELFNEVRRLRSGRAAGMEEAQATLTEWARECFGDDQVNSPDVRALRLAEEAIEFAQAVGSDPQKLHSLVDYVYARSAGKPLQELGGVAVTALVAASSIGVKFSDALALEQFRVLAKPREHFTQRNQVKVDAGFGSAAIRAAKEGK